MNPAIARRDAVPAWRVLGEQAGAGELGEYALRLLGCDVGERGGASGGEVVAWCQAEQPNSRLASAGSVQYVEVERPGALPGHQAVEPVRLVTTTHAVREGSRSQMWTTR